MYIYIILYYNTFQQDMTSVIVKNCKGDCIMLTIKKTADGSTLNVALEGRLDTSTSPQLEEELKGSLDGVTSLVFGLEKLEYISSAGLRVLLSAQKIMNQQGSMKLLHVNDVINEIFEVTGFSDILTIE